MPMYLYTIKFSVICRMFQDVQTTSNKSDSELADAAAPISPGSSGKCHLNYFPIMIIINSSSSLSSF